MAAPHPTSQSCQVTSQQLQNLGFTPAKHVLYNWAAPSSTLPFQCIHCVCMGVPGYFHESLSTVALKAGSLTKPGARQLTRLTDQQVSGILLCPVCCTEIADVVTHLVLYMRAGDWHPTPHACIAGTNSRIHTCISKRKQKATFFSVCMCGMCACVHPYMHAWRSELDVRCLPLYFSTSIYLFFWNRVLHWTWRLLLGLH